MRLFFQWIAFILSIIIAGLALVFFVPAGPETYFMYQTQFYEYEHGKITFYLVNSNSENGSYGYFFRVHLEAEPTVAETCNLNDFNWELRRKRDGLLLFSSASKSGTLNKESYFENKIDSHVFKGVSEHSPGSELGEFDFEVTVNFASENGCGIDSNNKVIKKLMRVRRKKAKIIDVMMSV